MTRDRRKRPVLLARTEAHSRPFLLDPDPDPAGNQAAFEDPGGTWRTRQLAAGDGPWSFETVFMPHVATCSPPEPVKPAPLPANVIQFDPARRRKSPSDPAPRRGAQPNGSDRWTSRRTS
jgi:hypothetical protein